MCNSSESGKIKIPKRLNFSHLRSVIENWPFDRSEVLIDMSDCTWVTPSGMVGLTCLIDRARNKNKQSFSVDHSKCSIASYFERLRFFRCCELLGPDPSGKRYPCTGRFTDLTKVGDDNYTDDISNKLVNTLIPDCNNDDRTQRCLNYIISELINNVCHHARSFGYAAAQYYQKKDKVKICIGDSGIGLKESLKKHNIASDSDAIIKALEVAVTSNPPHPGQTERRNRGVGLTATREIVSASKGSLSIHTGTACWKNDKISDKETFWQGTLVTIEVERYNLTDRFKQILREIEKKLINARSSN